MDKKLEALPISFGEENKAARNTEGNVKIDHLPVLLRADMIMRTFQHEARTRAASPKPAPKP